MPRTRVYREGTHLPDDLSVAQACELVGTPDTVVWIDIGPADQTELETLNKRLDLHALGVRDALRAQPRSSFVHYPQHDFLSTGALRFDPRAGTVALSPIAVFLTADLMLTVRADDDFPVDEVVAHWDAEEDELGRHGVGFLLHGLLEQTVQSHFEAVRALDETLDDLEDQMFDSAGGDMALQRRSHQLRKAVIRLHRLTLPTQDALESLTETADCLLAPELAPYLGNVRDHATRVGEWILSLRDTVATILQTQLSLHDSRMTVISKRVTGWAALIAIPALVTGFYGINVPFPGMGKQWGFVTFLAVLAGLFGILYAVFKRKDWL
ncbi:MAG: magnesium transporter CorA family protein [Actinocatenispora sp.]